MNKDVTYLRLPSYHIISHPTNNNDHATQQPLAQRCVALRLRIIHHAGAGEERYEHGGHMNTTNLHTPRTSITSKCTNTITTQKRRVKEEEQLSMNYIEW